MRNPVSRFAYSSADIGIKRSTFERSHDHKTTLSAGLLYPILCDEVLPGDTYSVDMSSLIRMSTPIHPVMDNCYLDTYWFFVPARLTWEHWKEFMGESPSDPYVDPIEYTVPRLFASETDIEAVPPKCLLDYLGIPSNINPPVSPSETLGWSALPVRGFCLVWNNFFRDQNLQYAIDVDLGDSNIQVAQDFEGEDSFWDNNNRTNPDAYIINTAHGGDLPPVNKYHDYFTSALIAPQKGDPVPIPLSGIAPVFASNLINNSAIAERTNAPTVLDSDDNAYSRGVLHVNGGTLATDQGEANGPESLSSYFNDLGADLSSIAGTYATINDLRYAFQLQKFLEADNRGGTRYREILKQHFNVTSPDASQQIPEFLGGKRIPINISQVLQTSSTNDVSPQGNTAAYSLTSDKYSAFTKSFTEHGYLYCVACVRTEHTYCQGVERMWRRFNRFDYYFPEFANISEQPIYTTELYNTGGEGQDVEPDSIFGYQEAWAEYRYKPNRVSAEFRPTYSGSLDIWHYGDHYTSQPYLSSEWIRETRANIDRTLAVNDPDSDQFIADFYFKMNTTRAMPVYSIPGLADHH